MPSKKTKNSKSPKVLVQTYSSRDEWLEGRLGRITGSKVGKLLSARDMKPLKGYWGLIAERVAIPHDGENVMDRGHRLEEEAINRFMEETGKKVIYSKDSVIFCRADNSNIAYSPDGYMADLTEDVEVKCLDSANHIEAWFTKKVPADYRPQIIHGFVVNDDLKTRYMVFYDPRMPIDLFFLEIKREDYEEQITAYREMEESVLNEIKAIEVQLTF